MSESPANDHLQCDEKKQSSLSSAPNTAPTPAESKTNKSDSPSAQPASTIPLQAPRGMDSMEKFHAQFRARVGGAAPATGGVGLPALRAMKLKGWEMPGHSRIGALWKLVLPPGTLSKAQGIEIVLRSISRGRKYFSDPGGRQSSALPSNAVPCQAMLCNRTA
ncbi:hypothetical protein EK904_005131 [Melospiza melodia maxima]|nr:hypothetical protein EK904_005131 [Melospiza melodia maxima]